MLHPAPTRTIEVRAQHCAYCGAAVSGATQSALERYDHIELPKIEPDVTRVVRYGGVCPCCAKRFKAAAPEGLEPGSPPRWAGPRRSIWSALPILSATFNTPSTRATVSSRPRCKTCCGGPCAIGRRRSLLADATLRSYAYNLEQRLDRLLEIAPNGREGEKFQRVVKRYRQNLFVFVTNRELPPTNNGSEQALRPCVTLPQSDKRLPLPSGAPGSTPTSACVLETARRRAIRLTLGGDMLPTMA
jgi:hypothetical protein